MPNAVSDLVTFNTVYTLHANNVTSPLLTQLLMFIFNIHYWNHREGVEGGLVGLQLFHFSAWVDF